MFYVGLCNLATVTSCVDNTSLSLTKLYQVVESYVQTVNLNLDRTSSRQCSITLVPWPLSWTIFYAKRNQYRLGKPGKMSGKTTSEGQIFANFHQLSKPLQPTTDVSHPHHLYNFEVDALGTLYTRQQANWMIKDWTTDNLPHPYPPQRAAHHEKHVFLPTHNSNFQAFQGKIEGICHHQTTWTL